MDTRTPFVIYILAVAIPLLGYMVEVLLGKFSLRGYGEIARDVRLLATAIHGKTDRDGEDIVLRGTAHSWPVSVRFSQSDLKPGLNIRMSVPSDITLFCIPRSQEHEVGRVPLHSADPMFEARFRISTNHPSEARIVFSPDAELVEVEKLCASVSTLLALENRTLELSELVLPEDGVYEHVLGQIERMVKIVDATAQMPGAAAKASSGFARPWNWFRTAYVGLPILLVLSILLLARSHNAPSAPATLAPDPVGISRDEAAQISDIQQWRLAQPMDFEPFGLSWLRQQGVRLAGRIPVSFTNSATGGVAYVLKRKDGADRRSTRLVMFVDGQLRLDLALPEVGIVARIPVEAIESIQWAGPGAIVECPVSGLTRPVKSRQDQVQALQGRWALYELYLEPISRESAESESRHRQCGTSSIAARIRSRPWWRRRSAFERQHRRLSPSVRSG